MQRGGCHGRSAGLSLLRSLPVLLSGGDGTPVSPARLLAIDLPLPPPGRSGAAIAITAGGSTLRPVHPDSHSLALLDVATSSPLAEIPAGATPWGVLPGPAGARHRVAGRGIDVARAQSIACNFCRFGGEHDGRVWTFAFAAPRHPTGLPGRIETDPLRGSGEGEESAGPEAAYRRENPGSGLVGGQMDSTAPRPFFTAAARSRSTARSPSQARGERGATHMVTEAEIQDGSPS
jgi:hypothetical protein